MGRYASSMNIVMVDWDKWDRQYMDLAKCIAEWSKDPSTKIGAVAIGDKGQVLSQGYNGFPRGIEDSPERLHIREEKYKYIVHAEMNCIFNASFNGVSLARFYYVHLWITMLQRLCKGYDTSRYITDCYACNRS